MRRNERIFLKKKEEVLTKHMLKCQLRKNGKTMEKEGAKAGKKEEP